MSVRVGVGGSREKVINLESWDWSRAAGERPPAPAIPLLLLTASLTFSAGGGLRIPAKSQALKKPPTRGLRYPHPKWHPGASAGLGGQAVTGGRAVKGQEVSY